MRVDLERAKQSSSDEEDLHSPPADGEVRLLLINRVLGCVGVVVVEHVANPLTMCNGHTHAI